jgi:SAM-dependent methyltransferase
VADGSGERDKSQAFSRGIRSVLPRAAVRWIQRARGHTPVGSVRFGDLRRLSPISHCFGYDRGTPIDRYYIDGFIGRNATDICGRVLEIGDNQYTRRFGGHRVEQSDILSVEATNPNATFVGDIMKSGVLPKSVFDCIIFTQTLQYMFDPHAAIATLFRALKPGGVLLLTAPSVKSQIDGSAWGATWYWWFTSAAIRHLLEESFQPDSVMVDAFGNILVATAFHFGLALEELKADELESSDPGFAVIVTGRAVKLRDDV